jgi:Fic family protein
MLRFKLKNKYKEKGPKILEKMLDKFGKYIDSYELTTLLPLPEELPDHLRKSLSAIIQLGKGRASDVAEITGRARAAESAYLNQLVRMGYLKKYGKRKKQGVYFEVIKS